MAVPSITQSNPAQQSDSGGQNARTAADLTKSILEEAQENPTKIFKLSSDVEVQYVGEDEEPSNTSNHDRQMLMNHYFPNIR